MPNIRDVAKLAQTSVATVSAVVNNSAYVSPALRARVLQAIGDLGYRPNAIARSLTTRQSKTIGLIIPNILSPFNPPLIRAVEQEAMRHGFSLLLAISDEDPARERQLIALMAAKRVDGLLISIWGEENVAELEALEREGTTKVVFVARRVEQAKRFDAVVSDNLQGVYGAINHLFDMGRREVALLALPPRAMSEQDRIRGYELAYRDRGLAARPELRRWGASS
ncbi:MAG: LacI family DNA-binding transcriptional regulator, partial [Chloroflexota bacterium]